MQFFRPEAFQLFWAIPLVIGIFLASRRLWRKRLTALAHPATIRTKLFPTYRSQEWALGVFLIVAVFILGILTLARPQWGEERKRLQRKGIDIVFLMDTSLSMLAEDMHPNRLMKAKLEIKNFVQKLKGDRIGMVTFAGTSFLQTPLTLDYSAFYLFLDAIEVGFIPMPGTSLDHAIRLALRSFPAKELKYKAIILFTDGEDHGGGIDEAITEARKANVRLYTIGVGTDEGAPIPLKGESGKRTGFKKDRTDQIVITRLNRPLLEKVARETSGLYLPSTPGEQEVDLILKHLESIGQKRYDERLISAKEDHFQLPLALAFLLLVLESLIKRTRKATTSLPAVKPGPQSWLLVCALILFSGFLKSPHSLVEDGNDRYTEKKYQSALEEYRKAQVKKPEDPVIQYNLATVLYQTDEYREAAQGLEKALETAKESSLKAKAHYNYGNTQYRLGNFDKAIEAYEKTLEIDPGDEDAKYNLEFLQKKKSVFEKKDQERKKNEQKDEKQKQQQDEQDEQQQQQKQQQSKDQQDEEQQRDQDPSEGDESEEPKQQEGQQQDPKPQQGDQDQEQKQQPQENRDQEQQQPQDQGSEQPSPQEPGEGEEHKARPEDKGPEEEQPSRGDQSEERRVPRPLQGQMTIPDALRILDALKEADRELQDLRRPPVKRSDVQVEKDW